MEEIKEKKLNFKILYLWELMDENYENAKKWLPYLYHPRDLKKLKYVDQNIEIVDIAFTLMNEKLSKEWVDIPNVYLNGKPYYPDTKCIIIWILFVAFIMTVLITLSVLYTKNYSLMTTLIVLISILSAYFTVKILQKCVIYIS